MSDKESEDRNSIKSDDWDWEEDGDEKIIDLFTDKEFDNVEDLLESNFTNYNFGTPFCIFRITLYIQ